VEDAITQATARPARRRRSALNRVDLLLIAASTVAFVAVTAVNHPNARARHRAALAAPAVSEQVSRAQPDAGLARTPIGAARMTNG
jgi:hypothetical protein